MTQDATIKAAQLSVTGSDMRDLLDREMQDMRATEAVALFCYQVKRWLSAFAAVLGGLDMLVFGEGVGENAPTIRARICDKLGFLGSELKEKRDAANEDLLPRPSAGARSASFARAKNA
jgi:acetate kinase